MKILSRILIPAAVILTTAVSAPLFAQEEHPVQPPAATTAPTTGSFGAALTLEPTAAVTVSTVHDDAKRRGTTVLVDGTIADVCTRKGCWLVVTDGTRQMRVTFKDYAFFVPKDSHGRRVLLEGVVSEKEISEEDARHYAGEATSGPKPEEINGPQKVVTMEAAGVVILDN